MRAVVIHETGDVDVLRLEEVERPDPGEGEVLVRVHATSVNPIDWKLRRGLMPKQLPAILGSDASGVVEVSNADGFSAGEEVFGFLGSGSYAEFGIGAARHARPQARPPQPRTGGRAARRRADGLAGAVRARGPAARPDGAHQRRLRRRGPPRRAAGRRRGSAGARHRLAPQPRVRARPRSSSGSSTTPAKTLATRRRRRGPRVRRRRPRHRGAARGDPSRAGAWSLIAGAPPEGAAEREVDAQLLIMSPDAGGARAARESSSPTG